MSLARSALLGRQCHAPINLTGAGPCVLAAVLLWSSLVLQLSATIHQLPYGWVPRGASQNEWVYIYPQLTRSMYQWLQFLEGFALGSAVVEAGFGAAKAYGLALFYSLSTPLGIAIGEPPPSLI